ncbi:MAG TPA: tRNA (adenosine(37)-N6)-threonylcarbamoyltransferase complex ATPase subunit type 1 TsaE [Egibacteraceae bacterium]|nr:tRNA (adenosine(37)-N6)-threonylcarbamoyltransferase complex ATPase subunit type 1 TsaE [Egibacteraceae bacterium]
MPEPSQLVELVTATPADTQAVAEAVARTLRPGDIVSLTGELGAGKTCFVQGAARGLGVTERVTSPSFVLRREYAGRVPVLHLDIYRLDALSEVADLGYEDALEGSRVTFIEWGDAMAPLLPAEHLVIELRVEEVTSAGGVLPVCEPRRIVVRPHGDDWARRLSGLAADLLPWTRHEES